MIREALPTNEKFGSDHSKCFIEKESAYKYFDELTDILKLGKGVPKTPTGVQQNIEVMLDYQIAKSAYPCH